MKEFQLACAYVLDDFSTLWFDNEKLALADADKNVADGYHHDSFLAYLGCVR